MTRYRFLSDDDGHTYLVPADKVDAFNIWISASPYWEENYKGENFDDCHINRHLSGYTFTDPQEIK